MLPSVSVTDAEIGQANDGVISNVQGRNKKNDIFISMPNMDEAIREIPGVKV